MMRDLTRYADRSCWISGDRVNACISAGTNGVVEFGFHGLQPVSRNSRMLVRPEGVLRLALRCPDGQVNPLSFDVVDAEPYRVTGTTGVGGRRVAFEIIAADRAVHISVYGDMAGADLVIRFPVEACFHDVRGERTWDAPVLNGGWLTLSCRDRIELGAWMKNTGPYAGDFLIPEHMRRVIFSRPIRSGQATHEDLRPEYRAAQLAIYDARTWIVMGGEGVTITQENGWTEFVVPADALGVEGPVFTIAGSETDLAGRESSVLSNAILDSLRLQAASVDHSAPLLTCDTLPGVSEFVGTVPALVRSCTVTDVGMTRATPGAYYWLWAWDNLVTGQECLRWGASGLAGSMVSYVNVHRDADGLIPARWTRAHEPMDTPPAGALDFLLLHLAYEHALDTHDVSGLLAVFPRAVEHLQRIVASDPDGLVPNMSFYPDRPVAFGRTEQSVVALETGCLYSFARLMDNVAGRCKDAGVQQEARRLAQRIEHVFIQRFWDDKHGFLVDGFDRVTGVRNETFPLFSLLFLQSSLGMPLVRSLVPTMARFMETELLTEMGVRLLPSRDGRQGNEDALGSWYPHWDIYLLKILRRAGRSQAIERWARNAERVLQRLGYVPEFIALVGLTPEPGPGWLRHGAVSNLNCVTGWWRAITEGLCGIELDPGGMSIIPLSLGIGPVSFKGFQCRGTAWDVVVRHEGPHLEGVHVDGVPVTGCLKVPARYQDGGSHELSIVYGNTPTPILVREVVNAEVLESMMDGRSARVQFHTLGMADLVLERAEGVECLLDGARVRPAPEETTGHALLRIEEPGIHELVVSPLH